MAFILLNITNMSEMTLDVNKVFPELTAYDDK